VEQSAHMALPGEESKACSRSVACFCRSKERLRDTATLEAAPSGCSKPSSYEVRGSSGCALSALPIAF